MFINYMNKIDQQLKRIKAENRLGIMTHIVVGYPNLGESKNLVKAMIEAGVDFIEMQIPFSDPMADGPTIMKANKGALDSNTKVKDCFALMKEMSEQTDIPFLFMGYFNTVFNYGVEKFCQDARVAGASGLIFPDLPLEEEANDHFIKYAEESNLYLIRVLSPASTRERIEKNKAIAKGFVYFVGRKGTTGARADLDETLNKNLKTLKEHLNLPVAVGFGISTPEHIKALKGKAEVAVIGSALLNVYNEKGGLGAVREFIDQIIQVR